MYELRLERALPEVRDRIARAAERSGRVSDAVRIVAVTKGHPVEAVSAAIAAGLHVCGENRVSELEEKVEEVGRDAGEWHLIGHLQRNKVRKALPLFDLIHSIDSLRLARELSKEAEKRGADVRGLVQVNASGERSKGGFEVGGAMDAVAEIAALPRLRVMGLMTMAPLTDDERVVRETFARTRSAFEACAASVSSFEPVHLSMGMSNDFELAVEEGSTMVRLGTVLFGERNYD